MEKRRKTNDIISPSPTSHPADSACVLTSSRDQEPLHYTLKIQSFSLLKAAFDNSNRDRYESQIFNVEGYKWKLALYPNGDVKRNGKDHISLYLVKAEDDIPSTTTTSEANVVFTFLVYDHLKDKYLTVQDGKVRRFHAMKMEWGFEKFLSLDTFNDASNGLLVDDCCAFGVDLIVMKCAGNGEVLSLNKQPRNYKYTWKFTTFSHRNKNFYESDPFTVEIYRWKIRLYPRGDSNTASGFLSLFLMFDCSKELPQGFQVYVEYEMAVLGKAETKKRKHKCWYDGKGNGWGSLDFISLSDLKEPTKGFLRDDALIIEVKINVISALKIFL